MRSFVLTAPMFVMPVVSLVVLLCYRHRSPRATTFGLIGVLGYLALIAWSFVQQPAFRWMKNTFRAPQDVYWAVLALGNVLLAACWIMLVIGIVADRGQRRPGPTDDRDEYPDGE